MLKVLVVDDQVSVQTALEVLFELHGLHVLVASSPEQALEIVAREDVAVVIQDMNFRRDTTSGVEGIELMHAIRQLDPDLPIVLMTAFTSLETAVRLVKEGANDYIAKPWNDDKLVATVQNALRLRRLQQENLRLTSQGLRARNELRARYDLCGLVYESAQLHEVVTLAVKVAPASVPVLITGSNGSGKEKLAEIVQANSRRRAGPFVKVNAGGLNENLVDAELFGAEAGAYTGAQRTRIGRFEEANGGTLFLDEIGNLSQCAQMKLLRVLQTGEFQRLGSNTNRRVDVRVISATNADLARAIAEGTFREDLYFRLNVIELNVPALRDRADDILPLARHFLQVAASGERSVAPALGDDAVQALLAHDWSGNVRELANRVQRAFLVRKGSSLSCEDLGFAQHRGSVPPASALRSSKPMGEPPASSALETHAERDPERLEIERALLEAHGVVSRAAAHLGVSRQAPRSDGRAVRQVVVNVNWVVADLESVGAQELIGPWPVTGDRYLDLDVGVPSQPELACAGHKEREEDTVSVLHALRARAAGDRIDRDARDEPGPRSRGFPRPYPPGPAERRGRHPSGSPSRRAAPGSRRGKDRPAG